MKKAVLHVYLNLNICICYVKVNRSLDFFWKKVVENKIMLEEYQPQYYDNAHLKVTVWR